MGGVPWSSIGLLILRLGAGVLLFAGHGLPKLTKFSALSTRFSDPLGVGSQMSLTLAIFAEVVCAIAVALGLLTRLAAIPPLVMLLVAAFVIHADDPWSKQEFAILYALPFLVLIFTGPGKLSLDELLARGYARRKGRRRA